MKKKFWIIGLMLVVLLGSMVMIGCDNGTTSPEPVTKVVDAKYIGEFWNGSGAYTRKLIVRETEIIFTQNGVGEDVDILTLPYPVVERYPAWTEKSTTGVRSTNLFYDEGLASPTYFGECIDENTIKMGATFTFTRR